MTNRKSDRIFLSASVPLPSRDPIYFQTADIIAIRDAVRALVLVVMEGDKQLVFGGHPAISPMVRLQIAQSGHAVGDRVILYQSKFFKKEFPSDNKFFEKVVLTDIVDNDKAKSLSLMRSEMLSGRFCCGIFIGGMDGVENEYKLFANKKRKAAAYPIASTGAAAAKIFAANQLLKRKHPELQDELSYISLMRSLIDGST